MPLHDWALEESLSAVIIQAEMLLAIRDLAAIAYYLPLMHRTLRLIESRRDPASGLLQCGDACNLLAPSFGGVLFANGTRGFSALSGLSVSYIASLDRIISLEKMAGNATAVGLYTAARAATVASLDALWAPDDGSGSGRYFVKSRDPDDTLHGVLGQQVHNYIDAVVNHDAVAHRVVNDTAAAGILNRLITLPAPGIGACVRACAGASAPAGRVCTRARRPHRPGPFLRSAVQLHDDQLRVRR